MLNLKLFRYAWAKLATMGQMFVETDFACFILEDTDRDTNMDGHLNGGEKKIYGETAIPYGKYKIVLEKSGSIYETYKKASFWAGRGYPGFEKEFVGMMMLTGIDGYSRVHIHIGNYVGDTLGCLLTGSQANLGKDPYSVSGSTKAFVDLYRRVVTNHLAKGEEVYIEIVKQANK